MNGPTYLRRSFRGALCDIYRDEDGTEFILKPVDRRYPGRKAPSRYLSRSAGNRSVYLSGLFPTKIKSLFSLDINDGFARHMWRLRFFAGGKVALLEPGLADDYRQPSREVVKEIVAKATGPVPKKQEREESLEQPELFTDLVHTDSIKKASDRGNDQGPVVGRALSANADLAYSVPPEMTSTGRGR